MNKFILENCNPVTTPLQVNEKLCKDDENEKAYQRIYSSMIDSLLLLQQGQILF